MARQPKVAKARGLMKVTILLDADELRAIDEEAERLTRVDELRRQVTRTDVIRLWLRRGRGR